MEKTLTLVENRNTSSSKTTMQQVHCSFEHTLQSVQPFAAVWFACTSKLNIGGDPVETLTC